MTDRPQEQEFRVLDDGVYDSVTGETYRLGIDGRLDGSVPLDVGISRQHVERFEVASRVWERAHAEELDWKDGQD
jgi:hypothetical protein